MITIWKYEIPIVDSPFAITMPVGSKILSFQTQKDVPFIWCQVNSKLKLVKKVFRLCGTGHDVGSKYWTFIGTIQIHNGDLVFHLFEIINK